MYTGLGLKVWLKIFVYGFFLVTLLPVAVQAQTLNWKRQLGTSGDDLPSGVAADSNGNVYISGNTTRFSATAINNESYEAWLAKYNSGGTLVWKQQLKIADYGSPYDVTYNIATGSNGNVYILGTTVSFSTSQGLKNHAWLAKYNNGGTLMWKRQLETSSYESVPLSIATDSNGNVYISEQTIHLSEAPSDSWLAKYNSAGNLVWKQHDPYYYQYIATDSNGNIYCLGANIAKYNSSGTLVWKREVPFPYTSEIVGLATDSNSNVYVVGLIQAVRYYDGPTGSWVAKYNSSGTLVWKQLLQETASKFVASPHSVTTDRGGNIYIAGEPYLSSYSILVSRYNSSGNLVWNLELGKRGNISSIKPSGDNVFYLTTDTNCNLYMSGTTDGSLGGSNKGLVDTWLFKYTK